MKTPFVIVIVILFVIPFALLGQSGTGWRPTKGYTNSLAGGGGGGPSLPVSGVDLWIDASQQTGIANGGSVAEATDWSGNARHMGQSTSGSRPTYQTAQINSLAVYRFAGTDDCLTNFFTGTPVTIFGVVKPSTIGAFKSWAGALSSSGTPYDAYIIGSDGSGNASQFRRAITGGGSVSTATGNTGDLANGTTVIWAAEVSGATDVAQWINGAVRGTGNTAGAALGSITTTVLGATYYNDALSDFFIGDVGEFIIYSRVLSTAEKNSIGNYLETKWGGTWTDIP